MKAGVILKPTIINPAELHLKNKLSCPTSRSHRSPHDRAFGCISVHGRSIFNAGRGRTRTNDADSRIFEYLVEAVAAELCSLILVEDLRGSVPKCPLSLPHLGPLGVAVRLYRQVLCPDK